MDWKSYKATYQRLYAEFAETVKNILEQAISQNKDIPRPVSVQAREKSPDSVKLKLQERGKLRSKSIEKELKDLAGVRPIFYTETDIRRFIDHGTIRDSFAVDWKLTKVHHPVPAGDDKRYQATHFIVSLTDERLALPEFKKFKGLRCEIQVQTILSHAWSETSHDMIYKFETTQGFGSEAFEEIKRRMNKIMDNYLRPADFEFQKAQHDYERLIEGKALFDRGVLDTLRKCQDNNERYTILSNIRENVVPNYDKLPAFIQELSDALLSAADAARKAKPKSIKTSYGDLKGHSPQDIVRIVIGVHENLRYVNIRQSFKAFVALYKKASSAEEKTVIMNAISHLARYELDVWRRAGPYVQAELTTIIAELSLKERRSIQPLLLFIWDEVLNPELQGTSWSYDKVVLKRGAIPVDDTVKKVRAAAIDNIVELYDATTDVRDKRKLLGCLLHGSRLPTQGEYSNALCAVVLSDTKKIIDALTQRIKGQPYELLQSIEYRMLYNYRRARAIALDKSDRFGCKKLANELIRAIDKLKRVLNSNVEYVLFKTLIGHEYVFSKSWNSESWIEIGDKYRKQQIPKIIQKISLKNEKKWYEFLVSCARTKSDDGATFMIFNEFMTQLGKLKPELAVMFMLRGDDDLVRFVPFVLQGLHDGGHAGQYDALFKSFLSKGICLAGLAWHYRWTPVEKGNDLKEVLAKAIKKSDVRTVGLCLAIAVKRHDKEKLPLVANIFVPAIKFLNLISNPHWVHDTWFLPEGKTFFAELSSVNANLVLTNMIVVPRIEYHDEAILARLAVTHADAVWKYFGKRLKFNAKDKEQYDAIPYEFHELGKVLGSQVDIAINNVRDWFKSGDHMFRFRGGRMLNALFPAFGEAMIKPLSDILQRKQSEDIEFVLNILENYHGELSMYPLVREIIGILPLKDKRLSRVDIVVRNTGMVSGEFGMVEAYQRKQEEIKEWLSDKNSKVRKFAADFISSLDTAIASEQRRAEQQQELRKRAYEKPDGE